MKSLVLAAAFAALAAVAVSPAYAYHCPADMAQIDEAMANNPNLSPEEMAEIESLRAKGEQLHEAGDHDQSIAVLSEAKEILGIE